MELGIIAIGIGLLVGLGVRKGSRARGGRGYQALAMVLTYLSPASSRSWPSWLARGDDVPAAA